MTATQGVIAATKQAARNFFDISTRWDETEERSTSNIPQIR